jgi:hypothetical protein
MKMEFVRYVKKDFKWMKTNVMIILKTVKNKKERNVKNVMMILYKMITLVIKR